MSIKLYYAPGACSFASHIALEELGIKYETARLNLAEGDQRKPEYLELNPRGAVPTLVVDGEVMTENVGILSYLAGGNPKKRLWPEDTWHQAKAISTMAWLSNTVHVAYRHSVRPARYCDDAACHEAVKEKGKRSFHDGLKEIDGLLAGREWAIGAHFTVVDGYLLVFYRWGHRAGLPVKELAHYTRLMNKVMARPAVKKVMADEGITLD
ncbi:MAG TPA: glutathione S-transferase N-terminal domain-containing protein [Usitatibacter sp.]|jgi:glutathione S-transferase|nr:glutathione S-transferase N-terminal domain-containing protein [Usitatibacter sp.]